MFSSALKSISSSPINSNYTISPTQVSQAGPWRIHDAKKKSTGKSYSVFIFDRKSLESHGSSSLSRSSASGLKKAVDEVVERLRKEASALARLRHPNVLELVEPVEEARGGGLQFVTEAVSASLASLLQEKDEQERRGGVGSGRSSRYVTEDADGTRRRREVEIDELEIQKGLLQVGKALEFLHDNAGLVHGNLTPDAILINAKGDWKISGLAFCGPAEGSTKQTSFQPISLHEVLSYDQRLPRSVQLSIDYTSPDFVMDGTITTAADMFSLGLLCVSLYNSPHRSPLETHGSVSTYKRLMSSSSTTPSPSNGFLAKGSALPRHLTNHVLPRLITRRAAQRMTAREFQESEYFDNILVSTIRFLDAFPAKTPNEKAQFMRGLNKVLPSFPKSVMEKKILPAILEETKDKALLALILQNAFKIIQLLPSARRAFGDRLRPALKETFTNVAKVGQTQEKDAARDAGLMVVLEHMTAITDNCSGKEFKDDILPIVITAIESPTPAVVDAALKVLPVILPVLDFSTIKNELFPVIATVFSRTNSLAIKVRGCQAFVVLCGGSTDPASDDGLDGLSESQKKASSSSALDKYTMQEKIVPLIKAIKTKEPAVMMAALRVLRVVGNVADADFVAMDILPILWSMSLGPLLDLGQFRAFMDLIKSLSRRVEDEQTKKLQELSGANGATQGSSSAANDDFMSFGPLAGTAFDSQANGASEDDFEMLVKGKSSLHSGGGMLSTNPLDAAWDAGPAMQPSSSTTSTLASQALPSPGIKSSGAAKPAASFSWSTPSPTSTGPAANRTLGSLQQPSLRSVTPDLTAFGTLTPQTTQFSQPLRPTTTTTSSSSSFSPPPMQPLQPSSSSTLTPMPSSVTANPWAASSSTSATPSWTSQTSANPLSPPPGSISSTIPSRPAPQNTSSSSFSLPPPPSSSSTPSGFSLPPPPGPPSSSTTGFGSLSRPPAPSQSSGLGSGMTYGQGLGGGGGGNALPAGSMGSLMNSSAGRGMGGMGGGMSLGMAALQPQPASTMMGQQQQQQQQVAGGQSKAGLDKYQSLL